MGEPQSPKASEGRNAAGNGYSTHILLVSAQAAPNLLPTLDRSLGAKNAILIVTEKMKREGEHLRKILRQAGVSTSAVQVANEHDPTYLEKTFLEVGESLREPVALNLTGGTKLMALTALNVANAAGWWPFYVDMDTDQVIPLDRSMPWKLDTRLRMTHYLGAYGFSREEKPRLPPMDAHSEDLLRTLVIQSASLQKFLGRLNWLAQQAQDSRRLDSRLNDSQLKDHALIRLIDQFSDAGMVDLIGDQLRFKDEASLAFIKGGWLERYVFRKVADASRELAIRDKAANLSVVDSDGLHNELDVAFIARNRLFIIECKTARMEGDQQRPPKANDALFKLSEICRRVGGLGARGMLVSYRALGDAERKLAKALQIQIVAGAEIVHLDERLRLWVG
jgi:hypothetical protein